MNKIIIDMDKLFKSQKEHYTKMIEQKIAEEEKIIKAADLVIENFSETDNNHEEVVKAKRKLNISKQRIIMLNKLKNLYEYSRIQAMSDVEIEAYKKEAELEYVNKNEPLKRRLSVESKPKSELDERELKSLYEKLTLACDNLKMAPTEELKEQIFASAMSTVQSINNLQSQDNIPHKNSTEIKEYFMVRRMLLNKRIQRIKAEQLGEIKYKELMQILNRVSTYGVTLQEKISLKIIEDPEKVQTFIKQTKLYDILMKIKNIFLRGIYISNINSPILNTILTNVQGYDPYTGTLESLEVLDIIEGKLQAFKKDFYVKKALVEKEFTYEKLEWLLNNNDYEAKHSPNINENFFNMHTEKYPEDIYVELKEKVARLEKLKRNFLPLKKIFLEKDVLKGDIERIQEQIYITINCGYNSILKVATNVLGIDGIICINKKDGLISFVEKMHDDISETEKTLNVIIEDFEKCKSRVALRYRSNEEEMNRISNTVKALAGDEYIDAKIMLYGKPKTIEQMGNTISLYGENEYTLIEHALNAEQAGIIWQVQRSAQEEANNKEMELNGLPTEQIRQMVKI